MRDQREMTFEEAWRLDKVYCAYCRYYDATRHLEKHGAPCVIGPPTPLRQGVGGFAYPTAVWPLVVSSLWCGKWRQEIDAEYIDNRTTGDEEDAS